MSPVIAFFLPSSASSMWPLSLLCTQRGKKRKLFFCVHLIVFFFPFIHFYLILLYLSFNFNKRISFFLFAFFPLLVWWAYSLFFLFSFVFFSYLLDSIWIMDSEAINYMKRQGSRWLNTTTVYLCAFGANIENWKGGSRSFLWWSEDWERSWWKKKTTNDLVLRVPQSTCGQEWYSGKFLTWTSLKIDRNGSYSPQGLDFKLSTLPKSVEFHQRKPSESVIQCVPKERAKKYGHRNSKSSYSGSVGVRFWDLSSAFRFGYLFRSKTRNGYRIWCDRV